MSKQHQAGSTTSYAIGFGLSLILTIIPYYLVVHKSFTGDRLLMTILGFAVLQMFIQIFFFLHLGRGPKPLYNVAFFASTVGIILVVVGGSMFIMKHLHYNMSPAETSKQVAEKEGIHQIEGTKTGACERVGENHQIIITNGFSPQRIQAKLCDTLSFTNQGSASVMIMFGTADQAQVYAGHEDLTVRKGKSETITLNQSGNYNFYDHHGPNGTGSFTVAD